MLKRARILFLLTVLLALFALPGAASDYHVTLSREEFDRWPEYPEYTVFNYFPNKGRNCTWYAHGRMMQLGYCKYALDSMRFNANTWADDAARGAEQSDVPKAGSIAFWESGAFYGSLLGHVGVVEVIRDDGSILVSDSSSSGSAYRTFTIKPDDSRWPTAFIHVPEGPGRSTAFSPGVVVKTIPPGLNFRQEGINQPSVLLPKETQALIKEHPSNGIYSSQPGSTTVYHNWWYAEVDVNGDMLSGWLAETYLEAIGYNEPGPVPTPSPEPNLEPDPVIPLKDGDLSGDGEINVRDVTLAMQHIMEIRSLDPEKEKLADVNGDGKIDVLDVVLIMRYALGLIDSFNS